MNGKLIVQEHLVDEQPSAGERLPDNSRPTWLASLMLKRRAFLPRFTLYYRKLAELPRPWRKRLQRRLAVTLTGAALLLALVQPSPHAQAATDKVITVVNGEVEDVQNGQCSLVEAIINARATKAGQLRADCAAGNLSGADIIVLPNNGSFVLTAPHNAQFGPTGLPVITSAVVIEGNGSTITRSDTADPFRILVVDPGRKLTLRNTTISNGETDGVGGGIFNQGTLIVENSVFTRNYAYVGGGGLLNRGTATVTDSTFERNVGVNGGAGIGNYGTMTIDRSTINWNAADYYGGGISNWSGQMTITNSTISGNNISPEDGGGLYNTGNMVVTNSTITDNYAMGGGGGIVNGGTLQLNRTIVSGNSSYYGTTFPFYGGPDEIRSGGTIIANNHNIIGYNGNVYSFSFTPGATDIVPAQGLDEILNTTLANNGGPTKTHALVSGSPAIDRAPNASCTAAPVNGVDQRGEPRNQDGNGSPSSNECDIGAFELPGSQPQAAAFFVSTTGSGTVDGVAFAPADILKYDPTTGWTMHFDGSDVGIKKNVSGFEILDNGHILLSFAANQNIPGLGKVTPQDVVRFIPTSTGNNTAGSFQWYFDGSAFKLTTAAEKIDALGLTPDGRLLISTTGTAAVSLPNGNTLKAQDEDALGFNLNQQSWSLFFDGTPLKGLKAEDVNALWVDPDNGDLYVSLASAFNLAGVTGNAKDIVKLTLNNNGSYTPSLHWDGSANGFPSNLDGLEMAD